MLDRLVGLGATRPTKVTEARRAGTEGARMEYAYETVARALRDEILTGTHPPGDLLPTIPDLIERFGVSRVTVRGAIKLLTTEGLVFTGHLNGKRGTIVRARGRINHYPTDALRPDRPRTNFDSFVESATKSGRKPSGRFDMRIVVPPPEIATRLGIPTDELVVQRTSYQFIDDEPWSRERSYIPVDIARTAGLNTPHDIPTGFLRQLAERGFREIAFRDEITDERADAEEAADLSIPTGAPLLVQTRTGATAERVTRVTRTIRLGGRARLIWETGDNEGFDVIRQTRKQPVGSRGDSA